MTDEIRFWRVMPEEKLTEINHAPLDLEQRLQEWLAKDISILDPGLMVIGREVKTDFGGYIDILCVDEFGDLTVVELKRDKTPREVTAQVLDYASWVADLSNERVSSIAETYLGYGGFEAAFRNRFSKEIPDTLNGEHRMLVVGSQIDASSERIIKYLSDSHGVNINAATFQFFRDSNGAEYMGRVFLIEPEQVDLQTRSKGSSKRRPPLTYTELEAIAVENGVAKLYLYAVSAFSQYLQKHTTRSSIGFTGPINGSRKTVISLLPGESNAPDGLRFQIYGNRFAQMTDLPKDEVKNLMPETNEYWIFYPEASSDYEGFQGFINSKVEIDRIAAAFSGK